VLQRILATVAEPLWIEEQEFHLTCSIGVSLFPRDGLDADTLLKNAGTATHRTKELGRNAFQFYGPEMDARTNERLLLEGKLRRAIEQDELFLHYQPQIDLHTGTIVGVEALLRWKHPDLGLVSPGRFIPIAEETGLIVPIGEWVLRTACTQNKKWQDEGLPAFSVAVNLSARQFRQKDVAQRVAKVLQDTGLAAGFLELELTESLVMHNTESVIGTLKELNGMGLQLAIDDFGTGYSSLSYLKRFPVDRLKIDQSFVRDIASDPDDAAIAQSIIALGHSLDLKVIAEGVETAEQLAFLKNARCDEAQGYYFSKPIPAEEIKRFVARGPLL
jgi:EAL domain-containing protein (putative c-di-GMP-specific phosphodiesterase class I)